MPLFGHRNQRRHRTSRFAIETSQGFIPRASAALRDRKVLARLSLVSLAVIVLSIVLEGWTSPFPYRNGDRPDHGILASVDFERINSLETERRRNQAASRVPLHFRSQPLPSKSLRAHLRADFQEILDCDQIETLDPEVAEDFGLIEVPLTAQSSPPESDPTTAFSALRGLLLAVDIAPDAGGQTRAERVEGLLAEFEKLLDVMGSPGIVSPKDVKRQQIDTGQQIAISDDKPGGRTYGLLDVDLLAMMKPAGRIAVAWESMPLLSQVRPQIHNWLLAQVEPTLSYDRSRTEEARRDARDKVDVDLEKWFKGQVLVGSGELIDDAQLSLLRDEYAAAQRSYREDSSNIFFHLQWIRLGTVVLMLIILAGINGAYLIRSEPQLVRSFARLTVYLTSIIVAVGLARWAAAHPDVRAEIVPVVVTSMIFAIAYNQMMAVLVAFTISLLVTLSTVGQLSHFVLMMSVSATAVIPLTEVPSRSSLIKVGFLTGLAWIVVSCGLAVLNSPSPQYLWSDGQFFSHALIGAAWCLGAGGLVACSLPFIEKTFGVVTDISLLEMSDVSHPLLQELVRRAPGTYNHSITVASMAESAAEAIGANGLLVRVGAYFHDIGKMLKPEYFIENITEGKKSRHEDLNPAMSTLIIIGHVKDGVDLGLEHHLPPPLIDFIEQHHGTTLVQYFYHEARKQAEGDEDHRTDAEESSFRYPGPKPQTREAGVMMLADAVESASRTLSDPTPKRIETLVHKITMDKLLDGQFEESPLTLRQIHTIEESLVQSLTAIHHGRIKYPEQQRSAS
jgi:hypothetical protein